MIGHNGKVWCTSTAWYETGPLVIAFFKDAHRTNFETTLVKFLGDSRVLQTGSLAQVGRGNGLCVLHMYYCTYLEVLNLNKHRTLLPHQRHKKVEHVFDLFVLEFVVVSRLAIRN